MSKEILFDPALFAYLDADPDDGYRARNPKAAGPIREVACHDEYFKEEGTRPLGHLMDRLVGELDDRTRRLVELRVFEKRSYREIAIDMGWYIETNRRYPDKKRSWRAVQEAYGELRGLLEDSDEWHEQRPAWAEETD